MSFEFLLIQAELCFYLTKFMFMFVLLHEGFKQIYYLFNSKVLFLVGGGEGKNLEKPSL
jgi:hypothetical protein